jgi:CheY-like chemotaxis protein
VQRWADAGQLKAWKTLGGHRRVDADSVERLLAAQRAGDEPGEDALSVLVVEDNPSDRDLLAALLDATLPGAQVQFADNGFQALLAIGARPPDLLVTDIVMPHMNGLEMLSQLNARADARPRAVLAVTSLTPPQMARLGRVPADLHVVPKPLDPLRFAQALQLAMGSAKPA